jgi:hypothetical protein
MSLVDFTINDLLSETRQRLGIPEENVLGYAISFGRPALRFHRTMQHGPANIHRVE